MTAILGTNYSWLVPSAATILAIESSCDETAAAVVRWKATGAGQLSVLSSEVASQNELHETYRGVVPEVASRCHLERVQQVTETALKQAGVPLAEITAVAAASRPGLIGSLLVGLSYAKALAYSRGLPFVAVDHVQAHLASAELDSTAAPRPAVGLVVSGGHTSLFELSSSAPPKRLGATIDDAAGEAFDKAAAMLNLSFPGGPALDELAERGNPLAITLPRPRAARELDFSFSGLKTALLYATHGLPEDPRRPGRHAPPPELTDSRRADLAASFRRAVVEAIVQRVALAIDTVDAQSLLAGGGVIANRLLRRELTALAQARSIELRLCPSQYCTDNAAMIGAAAQARLARGECDDWAIGAESVVA